MASESSFLAKNMLNDALSGLNNNYYVHTHFLFVEFLFDATHKFKLTVSDEHARVAP